MGRTSPHSGARLLWLPNAITIGQLLYAADDLSGDEWDHRGWDKDRTGRERLFDLALDAVQRL